MDKDYFSFSKLEKFDQCPYGYKLRYVDQNFSSTSSLAMEIGTIAHKCKELIAIDLIAGRKPDYDYVVDVLLNGFDTDETDIKSTDHNVEHILGVRELKQKYPFDWMEPDNKSGMDYDQKIMVFRSHLKDMEEDPIWKPYAVELPFEFTFDNKWIIKGYIDKIDCNAAGDFRIVDYKTSKAKFDDTKAKTSMQMIVYDMAVRSMFNKIPVEHMFDFVFLGTTQKACSPGYFTRGEKKLREWFSKIEQCQEDGNYIPKPTPLCHWCDFCSTNPNASSAYKDMCPYYSLWTPSHKTYAVNQKYVEQSKVSQQKASFWF